MEYGFNDMESGYNNMKSAFKSSNVIRHEVVTRNSKKPTDLVIADIITAVKKFGKNMNFKSDVAQAMNLKRSIEEIKQRSNNTDSNL